MVIRCRKRQPRRKHLLRKQHPSQRRPLNPRGRLRRSWPLNLRRKVYPFLKRYADHPLSLLTAPRKALYWLPASEMTDRILATKRVVVVGRVAKPSDSMVVIDVPSDYEERFGNGGNK